ncbi:hypothetical protein VTN77DRAFT_2919 [Rasamsonia byssochlamydoides]|uniref:uncharacterized protein n=1 Tax=Rasamsonia byssochlamydoides TaxID=89139 RepID=UPI0037439E85
MLFPSLSLGALFPLFISTLASPLPTPEESNLVKKGTSLNEFLSILLDHLPAINDTINAASSIITDLDSVLADLAGLQTTYNELGSGSCTEYTVLFARGTSEPGNVGVLVGPPLFLALQNHISSSDLTIQGVNNYAASVEGYLEGGDPSGSAEMSSQIESVYSTCPNTKLIVSGYSQGCQIVHNAVAKLPAATASWISSVLLFGDPDDGQPLPNVDSSKVHTVCHDGDYICQDGIFILLPHLTYAEDVSSAASFAIQTSS